MGVLGYGVGVCACARLSAIVCVVLCVPCSVGLHVCLCEVCPKLT